jgi:hypothetical protein
MKRYLWAAFSALCFVVLGLSEESERPPASVESHAILAYRRQQDLDRVDEAVAKRRGSVLKPTDYNSYWKRYLSYYNYKENRLLPRRVKTMRFWVNNLHLEVSVEFAQEVPGTDGLLYEIDLRDFGWKPEAFSAVARREPYFTEPSVDSATAILLRKVVGIDQDPKTLHCEAVVRADWFFRDTTETDRSPSYYDLLYSRFRFGERTEVVTPARTETIVVTPERQELVQDQYGRQFYRTVAAVTKKVERPAVTRKVAGFKKFPKDEKDLERLFAVDKFREHLGEFKIDTRRGAVVEGMEKGVSIVARQNRLIERIITSMGSYYKTFDVKVTADERDFAETLNKNFKFDAGEILFDLPAGGMGALLVDNVGTIVETADNRFATDTSDLKFDSRVRTPGSCFICHENKYIQPKNLVQEMIGAGIDIRFKGREKAISARGFFLNWAKKLENEQGEFNDFIARTSGFRPGENASSIKAWRDEYDEPVDLKKAIAEFGVDEETFKLVAIKSTKARVNMLLVGMSIPRRTWELNGYKEMQNLYSASRKK